MVIAVDADGTLFDSPDWPVIGKVNVGVVEKLKRLKANGHRVVLWTCREGYDVFDVVETMRDHGLEFDAVNMNIDTYDKRKVVADVYIDDRALPPGAFIWTDESAIEEVYGGNTQE